MFVLSMQTRSTWTPVSGCSSTSTAQQCGKSFTWFCATLWRVFFPDKYTLTNSTLMGQIRPKNSRSLLGWHVSILQAITNFIVYSFSVPQIILNTKASIQTLNEKNLKLMTVGIFSEQIKMVCHFWTRLILSYRVRDRKVLTTALTVDPLYLQHHNSGMISFEMISVQMTRTQQQV